MNLKHVILRLLGFRKPPPKTKAGKVFRVLDRALTVLALCYLPLILYPQVLFGYSLHHNGITLYAREPIPDQALRVLEDARTDLKSSALLEKDDHFRVFLCDSKAVFWLMSPLAPFAFASSYPINDNIMVARADVAANTARTYRTTNTRMLSDVIAHECGHVLIARRLGRHTAYVKPSWVQEGYCEYLAGSSTVGDERGDAWIRGEWTGEGVPLDYHLWRRMVEYLITQESGDIQQLIRSPPEYSDVLAKTRNWISNRSTLPNKPDAGGGK
jgi:hypothetical protein